MVLSGYQWFSVVTSGSQWLPMVLNGYQWFSVVLSGYQRLPAVTSGYQWFSSPSPPPGSADIEPLVTNGNH